MVSRNVIVKTRIHVGHIQNMPVFLPFLLVRSVGDDAAVGGIRQITAVDYKLRINNVARVSGGPGEKVGVLYIRSTDMRVGY